MDEAAMGVNARTGRSCTGHWRGPALRPQGAALVVVLWLLALLTVAAGALSREARTEARLARNLLEDAQARHAAAGAIRLTLLALASDPARRASLGTGAAEPVPVAGVAVQVAVFDEAGKIDLNAAPPELLAGLLRAAEVPEAAAARLADAIADWRDADDLHRLHGAEDPDYRRAGKPYGARDAPFESVDEVQLVLGMSAELYRRIAPALTVHGRQRGLNPTVAPALALAAVPGMSPAQVDAYLALRAEQRGASRTAPAPAGAERRYLSGARGSAYTVLAQARLASGATARLGVLARLAPAPNGMPFSVLSWQEEPPGAAGVFEETNAEGDET